MQCKWYFVFFLLGYSCSLETAATSFCSSSGGGPESQGSVDGRWVYIYLKVSVVSYLTDIAIAEGLRINLK